MSLDHSPPDMDEHSEHEINSSDEFDTDIEAETHEKGKNKGSSLYCYKEACVALTTTPVGRILSSCLEGNELQLSHRCLGPDGAKALAAALLHNTQVTTLNLADNGLEGEGCIFIADMLGQNSSITHLNLEKNNLGTLGALAIGDMLLINKSIQNLNISDNHLKDSDAVHLVHGIDKNEKIIHLNVSHNEFSEDGAVFLGKAIGSNNSIEELDLSWNQLRRNGAVAVCNGLKRNYCISIVDLSWNGLGYEGSLALGEMLRSNKYLRVVDVSNNRITWQGAVLIAEGLKKNDTLEILRLGYNPLSMTGCVDIVEAVESPVSVVSYIGFDGIPVNRRVLYMTENIQKTRQFQITHGGVLDSEDIFGRRTVVRGDPLKLLIQFLGDKGIRPFDLFRTFDKDHQHRVSREQFISGLKRAKVPLDDREIDQVLDRLDSNKDGHLSYQHLIHGVHEQIRQNREEERIRMAEEQKKSDKHERIMNRPLPPISETRSTMGHIARYSLSKYRGERPSTSSSGCGTLVALPHALGSEEGIVSRCSSRHNMVTCRRSDEQVSLPTLSLCNPLGETDRMTDGNKPKTLGKKKKRRRKKKKKKAVSD